MSDSAGDGGGGSAGRPGGGLPPVGHLPTLSGTTQSGLYGSVTFSPCRLYRYALTRRWDITVEGVAFVLLNPAAADAYRDDVTIRRCVAFARRWGFGSLVALNLFGLRHADPRLLASHPDPVGRDNDAVIAAATARVSGPFVAAWGVHGALHGRDRHVADLLRTHGAWLMCLGMTRDGHPRHPLYPPVDAGLTDYRPPAG